MGRNADKRRKKKKARDARVHEERATSHARAAVGPARVPRQLCLRDARAREHSLCRALVAFAFKAWSTVHVYSKKDDGPTEATIKLIKIKPYKEVIVKKKVFTTTGQELTAFRFTTDRNGNIMDVNELPANLVNPLE